MTFIIQPYRNVWCSSTPMIRHNVNQNYNEISIPWYKIQITTETNTTGKLSQCLC